MFGVNCPRCGARFEYSPVNEKDCSDDIDKVETVVEVGCEKCGTTLNVYTTYTLATVYIEAESGESASIDADDVETV